MQTDAAWRLAQYGPRAREAVPALVRALAGPSPQLKHASTFALGEIGPEARAAVPSLEAFLADERERALHEPVKRSLKRIRVAP